MAVTLLVPVAVPVGEPVGKPVGSLDSVELGLMEDEALGEPVGDAEHTGETSASGAWEGCKDGLGSGPSSEFHVAMYACTRISPALRCSCSGLRGHWSGL